MLDSDKNAPNARLGDTLKAVRRIDDPSHCLCQLIHLNVREIENLIPSPIYREALTTNDPRMNVVDFLQQLETTTVADSRKYLDLKKGLKLGRVLLASPNTPFSKYWTPVLSDLAAQLTTISDHCSQMKACTNKNSCKCIIIRGFGPKILDTVIEQVIEYKSDDEIAQMVSPSLKAEWIRLGEIITAWCCGSSRLSAL